METELMHCIYTSAAVGEFTESDIMGLLAIARDNNSKLDVTGMLLYDSGSFFQILEGEASAVETLFRKISLDKRHNRVSKLITEPIESRDFSEWTMAYAGVTREQLRTIEGLNDFFSQGKCYTELDEGRAKILLNSFKEGKWRTAMR